MRLASKHKTKSIVYDDFTGGLNYAVPPMALKPNELVSAVNVEYEPSTGILRVRDGLRKIAEAGKAIDRLYKPHNLPVLLVVCDGVLYCWDGTSINAIGNLAGNEVPVFTDWKNGVLIASGGNLQYYDGTNLTTIDNSPECDFVFTQAGRVIVSKKGDDYLYYSGIGDETNWNFAGTDTDALQLEVGYKDGGDIVAVAQLGKDLVVFKSNRHTYRVVGYYPMWQVYEISRDTGIISKTSLATIANSLIFLDANGVRSLDTVVEYGDVKVRDLGYKVNTWLTHNITENARIWHVLPKGQVWVKTQNDRYVYVYHYNQRAWTVFEYPDTIADVATSGDVVYVAIGTSLFVHDEFASKDGDEVYRVFLALAPRLATREWLVKRVTIYGEGIDQGNLVLRLGDWTLNVDYTSGSDIAYYDNDIAYEDDDPLLPQRTFAISKRLAYRSDTIQPEITVQQGRLKMLALTIEVAEV